MERKRRAYRYHSIFRRALYSLILIASVLLIGTLTFHYIEHYSYIDAFYFISMLATAQGPAIAPSTDLGKVAASIMAFVSVGAVITALIFVFGPFLGRILRMSEERLKEEEHLLIKDIKKHEKRSKRL